MLLAKRLEQSDEIRTHLLLELLVDGVQCILDGDTLQVSCGDFEPEWEVQIDLANEWSGERLLEDLWVLYGCRRLVQLPKDHCQPDTIAEGSTEGSRAAAS
jgi:hypothetical protein